MQRWTGAMACALVMASAAALPPQVKAPLGVAEATELMDGKDCGKHLSKAIGVASDTRFPAYKPVSGQVSLLWRIANCGYSLKKYDVAFKYADRATKLNPEIPWLQTLRMYYGFRQEQPEASLDALQVLSRIEPKRVRDMELRMVNDIIRAARKLDPTGDAALDAYEALDRAEYVVAAPNFDDYLRMGRGRLLLERGRTEDARKVLNDIVDIEAVVEMRVDRLFDPLRADASFEKQLDLAAAVKRDLERTRAAMQSSPDLMEAVDIHVGVLFRSMREAEGLAEVEKVLARDAVDNEAFHDADDYRNWLNNRRGTLLYALGRTDEGRAALIKAAGLKENGKVNVSNIINLGGYLIAEGRAAEAVALIPRIGKPSPYGQAWIEAMRSCGGVQLKDEKLRTAGLEYLKAHEADNPDALSRALICSNELDDAAALMIRRLSDKETQLGMLLDLQITPDSRLDDLPFTRTLNARFEKLRARADVRAAAEKVGRIEKLPVRLGG